MTEWFEQPERTMVAPPATPVEGQRKAEGVQRRRKYRGPLMAAADEDLRLSVGGKQKLGA